MHKNEFIMKPKVDFCFKELMDDDEVRRGFIAAVLNLPPEKYSCEKSMPKISWVFWMCGHCLKEMSRLTLRCR